MMLATTITSTIRPNAGARWHDRLNRWLVLVTGMEGTIYIAQKIYNKPPPIKYCLKDGPTFSGMEVFGLLILVSRVIVSEEFGTDCNLRDETGEKAVCALSTGNLLAVCSTIRAGYPCFDIIVVGNDGKRSEHNTGRQKAFVATRAVHAKVCKPTYGDACNCCSDWNDVVACNNRKEVAE